VFRVKGQLLAKRGRSADISLAENSLRQALLLANQQKAGGWVLKASLSLAQFLINHDQNTEARTILEQALTGFTDQDVGVDLETARNLLQQSAS